MIVKVQSSQGGEMGKVLVYNEDRSILWEEGPSSTARKLMLMMGDKPKVFMNATINSAGVVSLNGLAPDQDW